MILFTFLKDHCHFCMEGKFDVGWGSVGSEEQKWRNQVGGYLNGTAMKECLLKMESFFCFLVSLFPFF